MRGYNDGYTRAIVIVHGKSEYDIVRHIKSKLRVPIEIYAKDKGQHSIEISSILGVLENQIFQKRKKFLREYTKIKCENDDILNVKIFIILDVDSAPQETVNKFVNKSMFKDHWLYPYIHPILNDKNLEEALNSIGYTYATKNSEKSKYSKIFPVERGKQDKDTIIALSAALKKTKKSNLDELLDYCLENCPNFGS